MKRIGAFGIACLWSLVVLAQTGDGPTTGELDNTISNPAIEETSEEEIHDQLRLVKSEMEAALNARDLEAILSRVDEQVVFTTMNGDVVVGRDAVRAYFETMMNGPNKVVESVRASFIPEALSILHGRDTAISWGHTDDQYQLASGQSLDVSARWSSTLIRHDDRWLVASFHYSTNMFDNPVLTAQRRLLLGGGLIGALVLAAIGFVIGRRSSRRS